MVATDPVTALLPRLSHVRQSGEGWEARCPAHEDRRASLSVGRGDKGAVVHCHAGCEPEEIVRAVGLELRDLFTEQNGNGNGSGRRREIVATYDYTDEDEGLLSQVVRLAPKDFRQRRPDGRGDWIWNMEDTRRVPYRLPRIIEAVALDKLIHVVEGEKDVHAIEAAGGIATCNPGGAGKWRAEYSEALRDARVRIVADRDEPGLTHARAVAEALEGIAASVEIVQATTGKDAADHLAAGHGLDDFEPIGREPEPEPLFRAEEIQLRRFLEAEPPPRRMIIRDVLPLNITGLLGSMGGGGKSGWLYQLALCVAAGIPFLGMEVTEAGSVLCLFSEDDEGELHRRGWAMVNHLDLTSVQREAVAERVHVLSRVAENNLLTTSSADGEVRLTALVQRIADAAARIPNLKLIALDPTSRFRGGKANAEEDATRFVEAKEAIRDATGATVLSSVHVSKLGIREGGGQDIVRGSTALVDGVRWVATLQRLRRDKAPDYGLQEDEADRYLRLEIPKSNYTPPFPGLWLRREAGGVLMPTELHERREERQRKRDNDRYFDTVGRVQKLLRDRGPMSRRQVLGFASVEGVLGVGNSTLRGVLERGVSEGALTDQAGKLYPPEREGE